MRIRLLIGLVVTGALIVVGVTYAVTHSTRISRSHTLPLGAVTGQVLTPDGEPAAGASVYALSHSGSAGRLPVALTDKEGRYIIEWLTPGTYSIHADKEADGYPPTYDRLHYDGPAELPNVMIYEGQTTSVDALHLLPKAARLTGRIVDATTGKPVKNLLNVQITLRRLNAPNTVFTTAPDVDGEFSVLVPLVPVIIEVSAPGYRKKEPSYLHLQKEGIKRLDISLHR